MTYIKIQAQYKKTYGRMERMSERMIETCIVKRVKAERAKIHKRQTFLKQ